jgi:hypothetical protein
MGNVRLHRAYSITTSVEKDEAGNFAVLDTVRIGSSPEQRIPRFEGSEDDCLAYGEKLAEYWRRALEQAPSITE